MQKINAILSLLVILAVAVSAGPSVKIIICEKDNDCPYYKYCYSNKICTDCFNCSFEVNRKNGLECSKGVDDCGDCLPGYYQLYSNSIKQFKIQCVKPSNFITDESVITDANLKLNSLVAETVSSYWKGLLIVCYVLSLGFASYYLKQSILKKSKEEQTLQAESANHTNRDNSPPDLYSKNSFQSKADENGTLCSFQFRIVGYGENDNQMAVPVLNLENLSNGNTGIFQDENNNQSNTNNPTGNVPSIILSEVSTTTNTSWTPSSSGGGHTNNTTTENENRKNTKEQSNKRKRLDDDNINDNYDEDVDRTAKRKSLE